MHFFLKTKSYRARRIDNIRVHAVGPGLLKRQRQANRSNAVTARLIGVFPETGVMFKPAEFPQVQGEGIQQ